MSRAKKCFFLGANIQATDSDGYTPLHWAAWSGKVSTCTLFINLGHTPPSLSAGGRQLAHLCQRHGQQARQVRLHAAAPRDPGRPQRGHLRASKVRLRSQPGQRGPGDAAAHRRSPEQHGRSQALTPVFRRAIGVESTRTIPAAARHQPKDKSHAARGRTGKQQRFAQRGPRGDHPGFVVTPSSQ